jgi:citrate synthase
LATEQQTQEEREDAQKEREGAPQEREGTQREHEAGAASREDGAGPGEDSLSITDNRTGESYELEVSDGTIRALELRDIKVSEDDFGLMSYDPAFTNTASCRSRITFIDGEAGVLEHRGYSIEQLCEHSSYLEVAYLLIFGELPTQAQLDRWVYDVTHHTFVHENIKKFVEGFRYDAHPMGMLLASVGALSTFYPGAKHIDDPEERYMAAIRMIAKMPTLAAFAYRHNLGLPYVYPDNDLSYPGNFLSMLFKMTETNYEPDPRLERALDILFILHADHEQNCSTNAVRGVGSSHVDPYSAVAAGVAALYGPLHGGANEAVLQMLRRIESKENIPDFLEGVKNREERLMGFGHRVYKNYDPRARIIKKHVDEVLEATGANPLLDIATELEKRALDDDFFTERKLYPNVDFYSGLIYEALGIPTDMFTVIFAIPRTSGWVSQWMEMIDDPEQKIARPRQVYVGEREREYVPLEDREGPEKIEGPPARRPKRPRRGA